MKPQLPLPLARAGALLAAVLLLATPFASQAQDPGKALGGFLRSLPGAAGSIVNVVPSAAAPAATGDLLKLLVDSPNSIDEGKEVEIGRHLAAVLLGAKPLHRDAALQRYVNNLGRWISLQSSRPQLPWVFGVLDDPGFNAFAAPGGFIFVTKGLVDRVDETELAGILAHEIVHVTSRHHLQALRSGARTDALARLLAAQAKTPLANAAAGPLLAMGKEIYSKGLTKEDEFEADREGVALAARAGFDPYGLPSVLQQLRTATPENALFSLTISTHPAAQVRLDQLEQAMGTRLDAFSGKPSVPVSQRLRR